MLRKCAHAHSEEVFDAAVIDLQNSEVWNENIRLRNWFSKTWMTEKKVTTFLITINLKYWLSWISVSLKNYSYLLFAFFKIILCSAGYGHIGTDQAYLLIRTMALRDRTRYSSISFWKREKTTMFLEWYPALFNSTYQLWCWSKFLMSQLWFLLCSLMISSMSSNCSLLKLIFKDHFYECYLTKNTLQP